MPVGPSHRSRSSSSSSRSYSSSRSSSSRSYSSSSSRSYSSSSRSYSHRPSYDYDYYGGASISIHTTPKGWAIFGIVVGFLTAIIMAIVGIVKLTNNIPYHSLMRKDAREYLEIIEKAQNGEEGYYIKEITGLRVTSTSSVGGSPTEYGLTAKGSQSGWYYETDIEAYTEVRKSGINYYWFDISFYSEELDDRISGITYSYYSEAQVNGMSTLSIVYTKTYDGDGSFDIIQLDYSLDKNMDYWYAGNQILKGVILFVVATGLGVLMAWCCRLVKNHGKKKEEADTSKVQEITNKYKECQYCGSQIRLDDTHCSTCGAKKFNRIKKTDK